MANQAIYPGSFDPVTHGHMDVIKRAAKLFDRLTVAVIQNPAKAASFSADERVALLQEALEDFNNVVVESFTGLLVDYARRKQVFNMVRGLRAVSDFEYEMQLSLTNRAIEPQLETIFLMTDAKHSFVSSSLIKQLAEYGGEYDQFVPKAVGSALKEKFL